MRNEANRLRTGLLVYPMAEGCGSPFVFPIRLTDPQRVTVQDSMEKLASQGVEIRSLMGGTITEQPAYRHIPTDSLAECLAISREVSSLSFLLPSREEID